MWGSWALGCSQICAAASSTSHRSFSCTFLDFLLQAGCPEHLSWAPGQIQSSRRLSGHLCCTHLLFFSLPKKTWFSGLVQGIPFPCPVHQGRDTGNTGLAEDCWGFCPVSSFLRLLSDCYQCRTGCPQRLLTARCLVWLLCLVRPSSLSCRQSGLMMMMLFTTECLDFCIVPIKPALMYM